jgi:hypothetical protein
MPITDYRAQEAAAAAVPIWMSVRALWSRLTKRRSNSVEGHRVDWR